MIISASYKTDIPAFYGEWFMNRLSAGFCRVVNPYNGRAARVPLDRSSVDGIVFWTKNLGPFTKHLPDVAARGFPFLVQYTINGYPRALESYVTEARRSIEHVKKVNAEFGPGRVVWRYDTILLSSITPRDFHVENFCRLAADLEGQVDEVVISFMHLYAKTKRNVDRAAADHGFEWQDPEAAEKRDLASLLAERARRHGLVLSVCSQKNFLVPGAREARCVDADRLGRIAGLALTAKLRGNRKDCGCFESRDIGEYNTCPQGCVYCYAVTENSVAKDRFRAHDPHGEFLFSPPPQVLATVKREPTQLPLL